jgi:hypothetical protein
MGGGTAYPLHSLALSFFQEKQCEIRPLKKKKITTQQYAIYATLTFSLAQYVQDANDLHKYHGYCTWNVAVINIQLQKEYRKLFSNNIF